jgi:Phosphodiester glycosidase
VKGLKLVWASQLFSGVLVAAVGLLLSGGFTCWARPPAMEIFTGITYGCKPLPGANGFSGIFHWVRVDLRAPGIELYVTGKDPSAVSHGWEYRLRLVDDVVHDEHLAVALNASMFTSISSWWPRMSGDLANGVETVVADHVLSHVWEDTYLLWFDDSLTPHLRRSKPPMQSELAMAKWGIGGQAVWLWDGKVWPGSGDQLDSRTAVGIDGSRKLLFLAVANLVSPRSMLQALADVGAKDGMLLDGGNSTSMAIGENARGIPAGTVYGAWRPVAISFGVRAEPLR